MSYAIYICIYICICHMPYICHLHRFWSPDFEHEPGNCNAAMLSLCLLSQTLSGKLKPRNSESTWINYIHSNFYCFSSHQKKYMLCFDFPWMVNIPTPRRCVAGASRETI